MKKIGLHIIGGTSLPLGKPPIVKLVNVSVDYVRQVRAIVGPNCLIIVRFESAQQPLTNPEDDAQRWFNLHLNEMGAMNDTNVAFEGYNEIADSAASLYARFEIKRLRLMQIAKLRCVVGNWSVGTPDIQMWAIYRPVLDAMKLNDLVGLHEYWSDYADISNRWHCARWTMVSQLVGIPIVITESGRDYLPDTKKGKPGWQLTCSASEFLQDLREYDKLLQQFSNVVGFTVYQVGSIDQKWKPFEVSGIWPQVVAEQESYTPPVTVPPPVEVPMIPVIGKTFTKESFQEYVKSVIPFPGLRYIVVHHTYIPDQPTWLKYSQDYWAKQLATHYFRKGWTEMPHLFVSDRGILVENPLSIYGRGVAGHNQDSIHIETVGNYMNVPPSGSTRDILVSACATLLKWAGLSIAGLTNHRALQTLFTECPGDAFVTAWGAFQSDVFKALNPVATPPASLPSSETTVDPQVLAQKIRWWMEESVRQREAGNIGRADAIVYDLIKQQTGLLYRLENLLKTPFTIK